MKKVAIFDNCYDSCEELEKDVNEWIEKEKLNVIDIKIMPVNWGHIEYDYYNSPQNRDEKHIENTIFWYAVVTYEVLPQMKDVAFVGVEEDGDRKGVEFYKLKDKKPCAICGESTDIEFLEMNWDSAGCNTRICANCLRKKF